MADRRPEAKAKRKMAMLKRLTDVRKEKHHAKAEAEWMPDLKAEMKLKKLANRPAKVEKRRKTLMKRSQNFKKLAEKLLAQSKMAAMKCERMVEKEKVGGVPGEVPRLVANSPCRRRRRSRRRMNTPLI